MSEWENPGKNWLRAWGRAWLIWLLTSVALLAFFSLIISRTAAPERAMAYFSSALCFLAACAAGQQVAKEQTAAPLFCGAICTVFLVLPLLLCGVLIDRKSMSSDSIMSLISFSLAGALFGSILLGGHHKKRKRGHVSFGQHAGKRQR